MPAKRSSRHQVVASSSSLGGFGQGHSVGEGGVVDPYWSSIRAMQTDDAFLEGMLLRSVDHKPQYPYLHYVVYKDVSSVQDKCRSALQQDRRELLSRESRSPDGDHPPSNYLQPVKSRGLYREMSTYVTHDTPLLPKRPTNPNTAFSLSAFKTVGNLENLDRSWTYWSGADYIVENIPKSLGLERLTFHKLLPQVPGRPFVGRTPSMAEFDSCRDGPGASPGSDRGSALWNEGHGDSFSYVLLCEIGEALVDLNRTREFVDTLKYRQCGVTSMYVIDHFF